MSHAIAILQDMVPAGMKPVDRGPWLDGFLCASWLFNTPAEREIEAQWHGTARYAVYLQGRQAGAALAEGGAQ